MKKAIGLYLFICLAVCTSFAYNQNRFDSLNIAFREAKSDQQKVDILSELFNEVKYKDKTKAIYYGMKAIAAAKAVGNQSSEIDLYNNIGLLYKETSDYTKARELHQQALEIAKLIDDTSKQATTLFYIANVEYYQGNYAEASNYYVDAMSKFNSVTNIEGEAKALNGLGNIYFSQSNHVKAKEYYLRLKNLLIKNNVTKGLEIAYNNLGLIYLHEAKIDTAIQSFNQAKNIYLKRDDLNGVSTSYSNIGLAYQELKNFPQAIEYHDKALTIRRKIKDKFGESISLYNIGEIYFYKKEYQRALANIDSSLAIAKAIGDIEGVKYAYDILTKIYEAKGDYKKAFEANKLLTQVKDSIYNSKNSKIIAEFDAKYRTIEQQREIDLLNKNEQLRNLELSKQKQQQNFLWLGLLLLLIIACILLFFISQKNKKNRIILHQKKEVELKNKEITDSINYAQRIQNALLSSEELFKNTFNEHFILFKPKDIVSGDFYWISKTTKNEVYFCVADCTGHGVPGAFMSMLGIAFLNDIISSEKERTTGEVLDELRLKITYHLSSSQVNGTNDGMDISLCKFNVNTHELEFSGANNAAYIVSNKEMIKLNADKQPVGSFVTNTKNFATKKMQLKKGDVIMLHSDGYVDQFGGEKGKKFKVSRFLSLLESILHLPLNEQKEKLDTALTEWMGNNEQIDDICVVGLKV
jgi:serine phosphatase RsbU (regulator of sigma subunit)/Flp pilus assembly protein TadD